MGLAPKAPSAPRVMCVMKLYTAEQMRRADAGAAAAGVPTYQLMQAAGAAVARAVLQHYPAARPVVVLCGLGNNGGDGYVAASRLRGRYREVRLLELEGAGERPGDASTARAACLAAGGRAERLDAGSAPILLAWLGAQAGTPGTRPVVIDALLGSGLNRPLTGWLGELAAGLGGTGAAVVAIDVPSGLNTDQALVPGPHVTADLTVQLAGHKAASLFYPARAAYGRSVLAEIGIPLHVLETASEVTIVTSADARAALPARRPGGHKYGAGTVCVVAGSQRYRGAAELACRGAWRGGAGLVTLVAAERHPSGWPETMLEPHEAGQPWPPPGLAPKLAAACVIGPGLDPAALPHLPTMLSWAPGPVVLDATALNPAALSGCRQQLGNAPVVLTPHAGEAEALLAAWAPEHSGLTRSDPLAAATSLAVLAQATVVLKGPTTVIADHTGRVAVSPRGSPALASGGTGDVLAGLLGALLAAPGGSEALFERACLGVWLHGVAGELAAAQVGSALVASDVVTALHRARQLLTRVNS